MTFRTMIDFAYPVSPPQVKTDIVLIYAGGDTPHPFSDAEIAAQPARYRFPCWVRSNPNGAANGITDATAFIAWLLAHKVPAGCAVILDLETAVDAAYVTAFDAALTKVGYKVTKYGSLDFIFQNPKTSGGTFVANPTGTPHMLSEGDTVATQFTFDGAYDLSLVNDQNTLELWDTWNTNPPFPAFPVPFGVPKYQIAISWVAISGAEEYHYIAENASGVVVADSHSRTTVVLVPYSPGMRFRVAVDATQSIRSSAWSPWVTIP